jgi:hypothetical protein
MERFSFVTQVTGLNRPNTGKDDDDVNIMRWKQSQKQQNDHCHHLLYHELLIP